jgi:hypothetical protein
MNEAPRRTIPVGTYLVLALACVLYVAMLLNVHVPAGGGEARIANAYQVLFLTLWLWVVLAVLLVMCGVMGEMPRWAGVAAFFLHPLSGVAAFVAIDMAERHGWAIIFPVVLPLIIALYALWARLPQLHARLPVKSTSLVAWVAILVLSICALVAAL